MLILRKAEQYYNKSIVTLERGKLLETKRLLNIAKTLGYSKSKIQYQKGIISLKELDVKNALIFFQSYIASTNNIDNKIFYLIGLTFYMIGEHSEAIINFKEAINKNVDIITQCKCLYYLATLKEITKSQIKRIVNKKFSYLLDNKNSAQYNDKKIAAFLLSLQGCYQQSKIILDEIMQSAPPKDQLDEIIYFYLNNRYYQKVVDIVQYNSDILSYNKLSLIALSKSLFKIKDYKQSYDILLEIYELLPNNSYIAYNIGSTLYNMHKYKKADYYYSLAAQHNEFLYQALFNKAIFYHKNGLLEYSKSIYKTVLSITKDKSKIYYNLGILYFQKKIYFKSIILLMKAFKARVDFIKNNNLNKSNNNDNYNEDKEILKINRNLDIIKNLKIIDPDFSYTNKLVNNINTYVIAVIIIFIIIAILV